MGKNFIKLGMIGLVLFFSIYASAFFINERVLAEKQKEMTVADALIQGQIQKELQKAEEQAAEELTEQNVTLATEALVMKEPSEEFFPKPGKEKKIKSNTADDGQNASGVTGNASQGETAEGGGRQQGETGGGKTGGGITEGGKTEGGKTEGENGRADTEEGDAGTETEEKNGSAGTEEENGSEIQFDLSRGSGANPSGLLPESEEGIAKKSLVTMTEEEQEVFAGFLVEHYFLDGYVYAQAETDPYRKERKETAAGMEQYIIDSLYSFQEIIPQLLTFGTSDLDFSGPKEENRKRLEEFESRYQNVSDYGEEFGILYEDMRQYFIRMEGVLGLMEEIAAQAKESPNPLLSVTVLMGRLQNEIIPAAQEIINLGIEFKPYSNAVYLEGVDGTVLLSKEEVTRVIQNPGLILQTEES